MKKILTAFAVLGALAGPVLAQEEDKAASPAGETTKEKARPPRIPDAPFVPKRNMVKREKGQFWAGPPDEGRFAQILTLTLIPKEKLQEKLSEWPNYQELDEAQRARLMERIDQVRESCRKQALDVAKEFRLVVAPGQEDEFVRTYWVERVSIDQSLRKELQEKRDRLEKESEDRILQKYPKAKQNP
jgi:hypothetical protein